MPSTPEQVAAWRTENPDAARRHRVTENLKRRERRRAVTEVVSSLRGRGERDS